MDTGELIYLIEKHGYDYIKTVDFDPQHGLYNLKRVEKNTPFFEDYSEDIPFRVEEDSIQFSDKEIRSFDVAKRGDFILMEYYPKNNVDFDEDEYIFFDFAIKVVGKDEIEDKFPGFPINDKCKYFIFDSLNDAYVDNKTGEIINEENLKL